MPPAAVSDLRLALQAAGYHPTAACGKDALVPGWNSAHSPEQIAAWPVTHPRCSNTGILTNNTPAIDNDITRPDVADAVAETIRDWFDGRGTILTRFGRAPRRTVLFRTDKPFPKLRVNYVDPAAVDPEDPESDKGKHHIEILGDGQQTIVHGIHPDTKQPYSWHGGYTPWDIPRSELPELNESEAWELLTHITEMLVEQFGFQIDPGEPGAKSNGGTVTADLPHREPVDVDESLANLRPAGADVNDTLMRVIPSLLRQGEHPNDVLQRVVDAVMAMVANRGPKAWTREFEVKANRRRILSGYGNLLLRDFDPKTGEIPLWLPGEYHERWVEIIREGCKPAFGFNRGGFYLRKPQGSTQADPEQEETPASGPEPAGNPKQGDTTSEAKAPTFKFRLLRHCDLRPGLSDQDYLIDELLPAEGIVVVWGKFKCLKTFLMYDMMLHVAWGWEYRDRATRQGTVVYCAFEGSHGFPKRTEAQRRHYKFDADVPLYVMACPINLIKDHTRLIIDIRSQLEKDGKPAAVVLDTLNRSLVGSEGKDADMAAYIAAASAIREAFKCLVIIIHHCGWDETRPRGHSSLPGAVDGQLAVSREGNSVTLQVEFLRDGPEGAEIHSAVKPIEVGQDSTGKILTSLVVVAAGGAPRSGPKYWPKSLKVLRLALVTALRTHGDDFQEAILTMPVRAVPLDRVRAEFYAIYPAKGDTPLQKQDNKKHAFTRGVASAQEKDLIRLREPAEGATPMVWFGGNGTTGEEG